MDGVSDFAHKLATETSPTIYENPQRQNLRGLDKYLSMLFLYLSIVRNTVKGKLPQDRKNN